MTIKTGANGNFFFLKNKKWVDTRIIAKEITDPPKTDNLLVVCEPYVNLDVPQAIFERQSLYVTDSFLKLLRGPPKTKKTKMGNSYLFGPLMGGYSECMFVQNDAGTIGMIIYDPKDRNFTEKEQEVLEPFLHNSKQFVKEARKMGRNVIFNDEIVGGDLGCTVFIHQNAKHEITSLILENYSQFPLFEDVIREEFKETPDPIYRLEFRKKLAALPKGEVFGRIISARRSGGRRKK